MTPNSSDRKNRNEFVLPYYLGKIARHPQSTLHSWNIVESTRQDLQKGCPREYTHTRRTVNSPVKRDAVSLHDKFKNWFTNNICRNNKYVNETRGNPMMLNKGGN
jgi:hypothetical protein